MTGQPYLMRLGTGLRTPRVRVPGVSYAGRIEAIGANVTGFAVGDEVYGAARGTYAEYVVAPPAKMAHKPAQLTFEQAAVLPYATFAALQAVHDHAGCSPANASWSSVPPEPSAPSSSKQPSLDRRPHRHRHQPVQGERGPAGPRSPR